MLDKYANNRTLAKWAGYTVQQVPVSYTTEPRYALFDPTKSRIRKNIYASVDDCWSCECPNFYTEKESAILRDKGNLRIEPTWSGYGEYRRTGWYAIPMNESGPDYSLTGYGITVPDAIINSALSIIKRNNEATLQRV